jgi:hypothetical protein
MQPPEPNAANDSHDQAVEYVDRSIAGQVALGYDAPPARTRAVVIAAVERAIWKLRRLAS